jgi:hypothetical protein
MKRIDQIIVMLEEHQNKLQRAITAMKALGPEAAAAVVKKRGRPRKVRTGGN